MKKLPKNITKIFMESFAKNVCRFGKDTQTQCQFDGYSKEIFVKYFHKTPEYFGNYLRMQTTCQ